MAEARLLLTKLESYTYQTPCYLTHILQNVTYTLERCRDERILRLFFNEIKRVSWYNMIYIYIYIVSHWIANISMVYLYVPLNFTACRYTTRSDNSFAIWLAFLGFLVPCTWVFKSWGSSGNSQSKSGWLWGRDLSLRAVEDVLL